MNGEYVQPARRDRAATLSSTVRTNPKRVTGVRPVRRLSARRPPRADAGEHPSSTAGLPGKPEPVANAQEKASNGHLNMLDAARKPTHNRLRPNKGLLCRESRCHANDRRFG